MGQPLLAEGTVTLISDYLQANFAAALAAVSAARPDNLTPLEEPRSYFIYPRSSAYEAPAVFIICEDFDHEPESGQNFIKAKATVIVSIVAEERTQKELTYKTWRYQTAIFDMLNLLDLEDPSLRLKLHVIIKRQLFSDMFIAKSETDETENVFRKEVTFELEVVHQEQF